MSFGFSDLLTHNVRHYGDRLAVSVDDHCISYSGLASLTARVEQKIGGFVQRGDRVALWLPNCFAWIAAFLAIERLGGIVVPLSTRLTVSEVSGILSDCLPKAVVALPSYRGRQFVEEAETIESQLAPRVVVAALDGTSDDWIVLDRTSNASTSDVSISEAIAIIQYTSGTTSRPKGVMIKTSAYLQTAGYAARCQHLTPLSSFVSAAPFFHCSGSMHAFTTCFLSGTPLHTMSVWDPNRFIELVERYRADTVHGAHFRDLLRMDIQKVRDRLSTLKIGHDGAGDHLRRIHDELGLTGISNLYGMTETCGMFTMWHPNEPLDKRLALSGRPDVGNEIRIVDAATSEILPPESLGEIQLRGRTVTPGYFARPEVNAAAFTADGWFRTGDQGALTEAGELRYVARMSDIIRIGGENLAPAEVEDIVRSICDPKQLCVFSLPDERLDEVPVLVVVESNTDDWGNLLTALRTRLAAFKVPRKVYVAGSLPTTPTNKIQRSMLRAMAISGSLKQVY